MLKQRVITALVLLALLLPSLWVTSPWPFVLLSLAFMAAAGWEWARLNGATGPGSLIAGAVLALACAFALHLGWDRESPAWAWWLTLALWVPGGARRCAPARHGGRTSR